MTINMIFSVTFPHRIGCHTNGRIPGYQRKSAIKLIKVLIGLSPAPVLKGIYPNIDNVLLCQNLLMNFKHFSRSAPLVAWLLP